ncbi:E3 ubiquitin-protein ligase TRIM58 [Ctenodactylus gundi]
MASGDGLREEARCAVCLDLLRDPVSVACGHSFCRRCVAELCAHADRAPGRPLACPQCRGPFLPEAVRPNPQLAGLVERVRQLCLGAGADAGTRARCARHREELSRFCHDDQAALCWLCEAGPEHRGHRTAALRDAAAGYQVQLQRALERVRKDMEETVAQEVAVGKRTVVWKDKVETQRQRFRLEFEKHRGFLAHEEHLQLRRLEEEERATLQRLRDSRQRLAQRGKALRELAEELEERSQRPALGLLEGVRDALSRSTAVPPLELEAVPMELRTQCHIPGMREMLRRFQVDVLLDPATAHPSLLLAADLRGVQDGEQWTDVPGSAQRFDTWPCVLGLQSFSAGRHYWEVAVGGEAEWGLGVCQDSMPRKGEATPSPESGVWAVWLLKGTEYLVLATPSVPLVHRDRPHRVGVYLDYEAGEISLYDVTSESHIYTFQQLFSGPLRPYFFICDTTPILLRPMAEAESGDGAPGEPLDLGAPPGRGLESSCPAPQARGYHGAFGHGHVDAAPERLSAQLRPRVRILRGRPCPPSPGSPFPFDALSLALLGGQRSRLLPRGDSTSLVCPGPFLRSPPTPSLHAPAWHPDLTLLGPQPFQEEASRACSCSGPPPQVPSHRRGDRGAREVGVPPHTPEVALAARCAVRQEGDNAGSPVTRYPTSTLAELWLLWAGGALHVRSSMCEQPRIPACSVTSPVSPPPVRGHPESQVLPGPACSLL